MYIRKILVAVALLGVVVGGLFVYRFYDVFFSPNTNFNNKEAYILIPSEASFDDVVGQLTPLLKNVDHFVTTAKKKGYDKNVKGGKYAIRKEMNSNDMINTLRVNNIPIRLSFNNQETLPKLAGRIATQIEADSTALAEAFQDTDFMKDNDLSKATMLSIFIPNSYELFWNTSAEKFRDRMLEESDRFWNESRLEKAKALGLNEEEVITLASIVHKETAKVEERPRVAGVYLNRIQRGIPLQADPTVIYTIREKAGDFDKEIKRVLYKDLKIDSPYNTYLYKGLPPGPIAMPDISAIDAVLNAEKHDYLYFVADVQRFGYHKFAKTLAQHNRNKQEYKRWIDKKKIFR